MSKHKKVLPYVPVRIEKVAGKNILTVGYPNSLNNIKIEIDDKTAEKIPDYTDLEIYVGWGRLKHKLAKAIVMTVYVFLLTAIICGVVLLPKFIYWLLGYCILMIIGWAFSEYYHGEE